MVQAVKLWLATKRMSEEWEPKDHGPSLAVALIGAYTMVIWGMLSANPLENMSLARAEFAMGLKATSVGMRRSRSCRG